MLEILNSLRDLLFILTAILISFSVILKYGFFFSNPIITFKMIRSSFWRKHCSENQKEVIKRQYDQEINYILTGVSAGPDQINPLLSMAESAGLSIGAIKRARPHLIFSESWGVKEVRLSDSDIRWEMIGWWLMGMTFILSMVAAYISMSDLEGLGVLEKAVVSIILGSLVLVVFYLILFKDLISSMRSAKHVINKLSGTQINEAIPLKLVPFREIRYRKLFEYSRNTKSYIFEL